MQIIIDMTNKAETANRDAVEAEILEQEDRDRRRTARFAMIGMLIAGVLLGLAWSR